MEDRQCKGDACKTKRRESPIEVIIPEFEKKIIIVKKRKRKVTNHKP